MIAVVVVVGYYVWWRLLAKYRPHYIGDLREGRICMWCRKPIADEEAGVLRDPDSELVDTGRFGSRAHLRCEQEAVKRHLRYYRWFLLMTVLVIGAVAAAIASEVLRGVKWSSGDYAELLWVAVFPLMLVFMARLSVVPWARRVERVASEGGDLPSEQ
jgi:hypothetical protein